MEDNLSFWFWSELGTQKYFQKKNIFKKNESVNAAKEIAKNHF